MRIFASKVLIIFLATAFIACGKEKFRGKSNATRTKPSEEDAGPKRDREKMVVTNPSTATATKRGKWIGEIQLLNLRKDDSPTKADYDVMSSDFVLQRIDIKDRTPSPKIPGLFNQIIAIEACYKNTPEVTRYDKQHVKISGKSAKGEPYDFDVVFSIISRPADRGGAPTATFSETAGHPQAVDAGGDCLD